MASFSSGNRIRSGMTNHNNNSSSQSYGGDEKISANDFYQEFSGHRVQHLTTLHANIRRSSAPNLIWCAGDSSLDNKYWFSDEVPAVPGPYQNTLSPPRSKPDVTYWLNSLATSTSFATAQYNAISSGNNSTGGNPGSHATAPIRRRWSAINTAVEATTLNGRSFSLRPQDKFIRDHIQADDVLVVSVGGNDIALCPCPCTLLSIVSLILCLPVHCTANGCIMCNQNRGGTIPVDDCCCGCGPSLCSCGLACPPCLGYFAHLFGTRLSLFLEALTAKTRPALILVCMVYFPDEAVTPKHHPMGWADPALAALNYNNRPDKLQALTRKIYSDVICNICIEGTRVVPVPLFESLSGKTSSDYVARVEPSPSGGRKMAEQILALIESNLNANEHFAMPTATPPHSMSPTPTSLLIPDRG